MDNIFCYPDVVIEGDKVVVYIGGEKWREFATIQEAEEALDRLEAHQP